MRRLEECSYKIRMKITMKFQQIFENFVGIGANRIRQKIDLLVCDLKTLENVQLTSKNYEKNQRAKANL